VVDFDDISHPSYFIYLTILKKYNMCQKVHAHQHQRFIATSNSNLSAILKNLDTTIY
jgi:hypothetical protein